MIIDPYKEKRVSFTLNLEGTSHDDIDISMLIDIEDFELKVPMKIENGKVIGIIPKLNELREKLPEEVGIKVVVIAEGDEYTVFEKKIKVEDEAQENVRIEEMKREEASKIESEYKNKQKEIKKIAEDMVNEREKVREDIDRLTAKKQIMEEIEIGWILKEEIARKKIKEFEEKKSFAERIAKGINEKKEEKVEPKIDEKKKMVLGVGDKVKMLRGTYKGKIGKVIDFSVEDDQVDVKFSDGKVRYPGFDDIKIVEEKVIKIETPKSKFVSRLVKVETKNSKKKIERSRFAKRLES